MMFELCVGGCVKLKKNLKIREKLGSEWVGQAPTKILFFLEMLCFFCCFFVVVHVSKKKEKG